MGNLKLLVLNLLTLNQSAAAPRGHQLKRSSKEMTSTTLPVASLTHPSYLIPSKEKDF